MKITAIETIRTESHPNILWVEIHTDQGLAGLGETFYGAAQAEAHIHAYLAPILLGRDPRPIERHWRAMVPYCGYVGSSAEMRALSAIDIALWDLGGQAMGVPVHQLLGGAVRDEIRVYNTCAGYRYVQNRPAQGTDNFGLPGAGARGDYEDLDAFLHRADELAASLLEMGIGAMKIWPFDFAAEANRGLSISPAELEQALEPFAKIRRAHGDRIEVMAELHALWLKPAACEIAVNVAAHERWVKRAAASAADMGDRHRRADIGRLGRAHQHDRVPAERRAHRLLEAAPARGRACAFRRRLGRVERARRARRAAAGDGRRRAAHRRGNRRNARA